MVIKLGNYGLVYASNTTRFFLPAVLVDQVKDPTGAGDSFAGGLLGYISTNGLSDINKAVAFGSAVASYTVSGFGLESLVQINLEDLRLKANSINIRYGKTFQN